MKINNKDYPIELGWWDSADYLPRESRSEEYAQTLMVGKAGAFCSDRINFVSFIKAILDGDRYLEIGTFDGIVISILAELFPYKEFHAIDKFSVGFNTASGCLQYFIDNNKHNNNVFLYVGDSTEVCPQLTGLFDVIFIDGDHSYDWVKTDIQNVWSLLRPKGILAFHDCGSHPEVTRAINEYFYELLWYGEIAYIIKGVSNESKSVTD
jgi:predicted O-methyltransferase YrrM